MPFDERGRDLAVTDGLWVITFGQRGLIGLVALTMIILLPAVLVFRRFPARKWKVAALAPAVALSVSLVLYMIDSLFIAMVNPIFVLAAGIITGLGSRDPGSVRPGLASPSPHPR